MTVPLDRPNPFLAEDALACSLSGRLQSKSRSTIFKLASAEILNFNDNLAGFFRVVPNEIIYQIFHQLDLVSLANLACTSKGMGRVVRSLPELRPLLSCAPDAIRAVTAAKVGHRLVCSDMYRKLVKPNCDDCSRPGEYLHLLSCRRLCFQCLSDNPRYPALRPLQAVEQYNLPMCHVVNLPTLVVPPYSAEGCKLRCRRRKLQINTTGWKLIDMADVDRLSIETHGSVDNAKRRAFERLTRLRSRLGRDPMSNEDWLRSRSASRRRFRMACRRDRLTPLREEDFEGRLGAHMLPDVESAYSTSTLFPWFDISTDFFGCPGLCELCRDAGLPLRQCFYTIPGRDCHMEKHTT
ncbi:hypothetical protein BM221_001293 [Beauveria bassiana]|uniref:F-box domain-containing protein n=1 Tax=Beauveria bassiana TaxID=176275 RepID=A0A2N6P2Z2_BEABA|nr:hypothetical protein BM221_001293 [Beauveria bassiana]